MTIAFHVVSERSIEIFIEQLKEEFLGVTVNKGRNQSYLGMNLDMYDEYCSVLDMKGYIEKIVKDHRSDKSSIYPANSHLELLNARISFTSGKSSIRCKEDKNSWY